MKQKIFPNWWQSICILLVFMIFLFLSEIILTSTIKEFSSYFKTFSYFLFLIFEIPFLWLMYKKAKLNIWKQVKIPSINLILLTISIAIILALIIRPFAYPKIYFEALTGRSMFRLPQALLSSSNKILVLNRFFIICIIAPIIEEVVDRGLILKQLLKQYPPYVSIILLAIVFSLSHFGESMGALLILSIIISLVYYITNSLIISIVFHVCYNLIVSILPFTYAKHEMLFYTPWYVLVIIAGIVAICILMKRISNETKSF